ncbi:MAG: pantoate--beta-alanine ligase [bacterium]|nr:pantoate--beta-alanine ligase [Acidimicrobiia bacterium]MCY4650102.1 pantoate--beta-alanine ligase [bacterium]
MKVVHSFADARSAARYSRDGGGGKIGLVPTMGFLHEGHLSLMAQARRECGVVMMSLYVNPRQFNQSSDFDIYPRSFDRDRQLAAEAGVDVLFAPPTEEVYQPGESIMIEPGAVAASMEGRHRPGHFQGVALVVAKLLAGLGAERAYFGRKDAQQLAMIRQLTHDLCFPIEIVGCPTMREMDGLALSSRNFLIPAEHRETALGISRGLERAGRAVEAGERSADPLRRLVTATPASLEWQYVELADQHDASLLRTLDRPSFLAVAAKVADVRLIDNLFFDRCPDGLKVDRGIRLEAPSLLYQ